MAVSKEYRIVELDSGRVRVEAKSEEGKKLMRSWAKKGYIGTIKASERTSGLAFAFVVDKWVFRPTFRRVGSGS